MSRKRILILLLVAAVLGGTTVYATWFRRDNALQGSGTVEARDIRVGSKVSGRIDKVLVRLKGGGWAFDEPKQKTFTAKIE